MNSIKLIKEVHNCRDRNFSKKQNLMESVKSFLINNRESDIYEFMKRTIIVLLRDYCFFTDYWLVPKYLPWNKCSPAFPFYTEHYPKFQEVFFPSYYIFNNNTIRSLVLYRLDCMNLWIKYIKKDSLYQALPVSVSKVLQTKNLEYPEFYYIYKKYGSQGVKYLTFISKYLDKDLTKYFELLKVQKFLN